MPLALISQENFSSQVKSVTTARPEKSKRESEAACRSNVGLETQSVIGSVGSGPIMLQFFVSGASV
jgi:hypothetical protein